MNSLTGKMICPHAQNKCNQTTINACSLSANINMVCVELGAAKSIKASQHVKLFYSACVSVIILIIVRLM